MVWRVGDWMKMALRGRARSRSVGLRRLTYTKMDEKRSGVNVLEMIFFCVAFVLYQSCSTSSYV